MQIKISAKNINAYFQVGIKLKIGRNNGVPAHTMVNILMEIVLNLGAEI